MTAWHPHRCDNKCQTTTCYFHPYKKHGLDADHPITIRTFVERFGCGRYTPVDPIEDARLAIYQSGFEEGFEIGKAQCETHHEDMLWAERERVLDEIGKGIMKLHGIPRGASFNPNIDTIPIVGVDELGHLIQSVREGKV